MSLRRTKTALDALRDSFKCDFCVQNSSQQQPPSPTTELWQVACCAHVFCRSCVDVAQSSRKCPICFLGFDARDCCPNRQLNRLIELSSKVAETLAKCQQFWCEEEPAKNKASQHKLLNELKTTAGGIDHEVRRTVDEYHASQKPWPTAIEERESEEGELGPNNDDAAEHFSYTTDPHQLVDEFGPFSLPQRRGSPIATKDEQNTSKSEVQVAREFEVDAQYADVPLFVEMSSQAVPAAEPMKTKRLGKTARSLSCHEKASAQLSSSVRRRGKKRQQEDVPRSSTCTPMELRSTDKSSNSIDDREVVKNLGGQLSREKEVVEEANKTSVRLRKLFRIEKKTEDMSVAGKSAMSTATVIRRRGEKSLKGRRVTAPPAKGRCVFPQNGENQTVPLLNDAVSLKSAAVKRVARRSEDVETNVSSISATTLSSSTVAGRKKQVQVLRNNKGETKLHAAARNVDVDVLNAFLKSNSEDVNGQDNNGWTTLHEAAAVGSLGCLIALIHDGAVIDAPSYDMLQSPLHLAILRGQPEAVECLVRAGADPRQIDLRGLTAVEYVSTLANHELEQRLRSALETPTCRRRTVQRKQSAESVRIALSCSLADTANRCAYILAARYTNVSFVGSTAGGRRSTERSVKYQSSLPDDTTHFVVKVEEGTKLATMRTSRVCEAILKKIFLVSSDWLVDSCERNELLAESDYEVDTIVTKDKGIWSNSTPKKARASKLALLPGLFRGCNFHFLKHNYVKFALPPMEAFKRFVSLGGGNVLSRLPSEAMLNEDASLATVPFFAAEDHRQFMPNVFVVYMPGEEKSSTKQKYLANSGKVKRVTPMWIYDCISSFSILLPDGDA